MGNSLIKKTTVSSDNELKQYLMNQANSYERLYHYTTYEALLSIIKGKCFRLSRLDLLNDKAELKLGQHNEMIKHYVMSFTREKEYVSMWAMYGKTNGIKLRLDFDGKNFFNKKAKIYSDSEKHTLINKYTTKKLFELEPGNYREPIQFSDIAYLDKTSNTIKHNTRPFKGLSVNEKIIDSITGFVKYDAWEFEKETRLKVQLSKDNYSTDKELPEYIYYSIPDDLIRSFHVTYNPWMSQILKEEIQKSLSRICGYEIQCDDSADDGEISVL